MKLFGKRKKRKKAGMKKRMIRCGHNDLRSYPEIESLLHVRMTIDDEDEQAEMKKTR